MTTEMDKRFLDAEDLDPKELEEILARDCMEEEDEDDLGKDGALYKKMYYKAFNHITDIIEGLKKLQIELEEIYINGGE